MSLDPATLNHLAVYGISFLAAFLAALWLTLIVWTRRDIRQRSRSRFSRALAVIAVILFSLPGFLLYLILRPPHTLEEAYQHTLEEEALLQAIEESTLCPGCARRVQSDWLVCPVCNTLLKKNCQNCGRLLELPWNICPYCAAAVPGMRKVNTRRKKDPVLDEGYLPILDDDLDSQP